MKDEHREIGAVKWPVYKSYLRASWVLFFPTVSLESSDFDVSFL